MVFRNPASFVARPQLTVAGAVAVLAPTLLTTALLSIASSPVAAQVINLSAVAAGTGGFVLNGQAINDNSGTSVASAGDVNGDGLGDLIIGVNFADPGGVSNAGRSYVVFGQSGTTAVNLSAVASGVGGFVINGQSVRDYSGQSVAAAGDVNADGLADVVVGAPYADPPAGTSAGRTYVVFGKTSTTPVEASAVVAGTGGFVINGGSSLERSGTSVSGAGDTDGDGFADVIVGAPRYATGARPSAGRSYIVFGKTDGSAVDASALATGTSGLGSVIYGQTDDRSGVSVASAGDVDGDGKADVIVGAAGAPGGIAPGRAYLVIGRTSGGIIELSAISAGLGGGFVINSEASGQQLGYSVSGAGDVNGDGLADLIAGARS